MTSADNLCSIFLHFTRSTFASPRPHSICSPSVYSYLRVRAQLQYFQDYGARQGSCHTFGHFITSVCSYCLLEISPVSGKTTESVHSTITDPCQYMRHRLSAHTLQRVTVPIRNIYPVSIAPIWNQARIGHIQGGPKNCSFLVCLNFCSRQRTPPATVAFTLV